MLLNVAIEWSKVMPKYSVSVSMLNMVSQVEYFNENEKYAKK